MRLLGTIMMAALLAVVAVTSAGGGGARASGAPEGLPATVVPPPWGAGTREWWYESGNQINLTLPAAVVAGTNVKVYVVAATGLESNAQLIDVLP